MPRGALTSPGRFICVQTLSQNARFVYAAVPLEVAIYGVCLTRSERRSSRLQGPQIHQGTPTSSPLSWVPHGSGRESVPHSEKFTIPGGLDSQRERFSGSYHFAGLVRPQTPGRHCRPGCPDWPRAVALWASQHLDGGISQARGKLTTIVPDDSFHGEGVAARRRRRAPALRPSRRSRLDSMSPLAKCAKAVVCQPFRTSGEARMRGR